jgi:hypothetical protein
VEREKDPTTHRVPPLPLLAEATFAPDAELYEVITFLNRALKAKGFVFGYTRRADGFSIAVYEAKPWK